MLHTLQKTKCDPLLLLPLLLLPQHTQMKFKQEQPQQQQETSQFKYENSTKESKLHFSDLQTIHLYMHICFMHMLQLIEILWSVTNGP